MSTAAAGGMSASIANIRPAADTEALGTLTVESAFDSSLVVIVDGSGSMSPNPASEDETVTFSMDIRNDNDQDATVDVNFFDGAGDVWVGTTGFLVAAGATGTVSLDVIPENIPKSPGDYSMTGEIINVAESATLTQTLALDTPTRKTAIAAVGGGLAAGLAGAIY